MGLENKTALISIALGILFAVVGVALPLGFDVDPIIWRAIFCVGMFFSASLGAYLLHEHFAREHPDSATKRIRTIQFFVGAVIIGALAIWAAVAIPEPRNYGALVLAKLNSMSLAAKAPATPKRAETPFDSSSGSNTPPASSNARSTGLPPRHPSPLSSPSASGASPQSHGARCEPNQVDGKPRLRIGEDKFCEFNDSQLIEQGRSVIANLHNILDKFRKDLSNEKSPRKEPSWAPDPSIAYLNGPMAQQYENLYPFINSYRIELLRRLPENGGIDVIGKFLFKNPVDVADSQDRANPEHWLSNTRHDDIVRSVIDDLEKLTNQLEEDDKAASHQATSPGGVREFPSLDPNFSTLMARQVGDAQARIQVRVYSAASRPFGAQIMSALTAANWTASDFGNEEGTRTISGVVIAVRDPLHPPTVVKRLSKAFGASGIMPAIEPMPQWPDDFVRIGVGSFQ